jgi:hypothetical protein
VKLHIKPAAGIVALFLAGAFIQAPVMAEDESPLAGTNSLAADSGNGLFNGLDHRSAYFRDFFPQPLLVEETSLEEGELEFGSLHTQAGDQHADTVTAGVQKSFGLLTMELEVPYQRNADEGGVSQGIGSISLDARYPLYQWISAGGLFDTTLGVAMEAGLPVNSVAGGDTELDPMIFNDLKLAGYFSLQSVFGWSTLIGGGDNGGLQTFEYGLDFACAIPSRDLPLPGVEQFTPMFELVGETELNQEDAGQNSLLGSLGARIQFKPLGGVHPGLGLGFVFPLDPAARAEVHWGIATSLTLEF